MKSSKIVRTICFVLAALLVASLCYTILYQLIPDLHGHAHPH